MVIQPQLPSAHPGQIAIAILCVITNAGLQVTYLNGIVMPDDDEQDSSSDEDEARAEDSTEGSPEA